MRFALIILGCLLSQVAMAQHDVILRTNGEEIQAKILTVGPEAIRYVRRDTASTDTLRIAATEVFLVRYANGTRELIKQPAVASSGLVGLSRSEAMRQGTADARKYFRAPGTFWGTYGATLVNPLAGLVTGVAVGGSRPPTHNLTVPDANLLQNPDYVRAYRQQAKNQKLGKAAAGFGAGMGTLLVVVAVILNSTTHW
ncbi:hypothetical protein [Hymenobacter cellulosilyticus]|uniref:Secreted protein n=1 Tax=Hymenobacter cellulosilyticus TaxID=2932248 RepID=A0A8T9Q6Z0_9BACT|nr:hypothetical protein [Hymenobacter cellulosilyticus]UOQ72895.1 hypothetical protein MUN79_02600 [Hymenobacter cellulosilyticus]